MNPLKIDRVERSPLLIIGAGIAGLSAALSVRECTVLARSPAGKGGATAWAQGGIAAAIDAADSAAEHAKDTLAAGGGIVDPAAAKMLTEAGLDAIEWLISLGADFDRTAEGVLALSREGGHHRRRVVHAEGDATGAEILRALTDAAGRSPGIRFAAGARALDFAIWNGRVVGAIAQRTDGSYVLHLAPATVLATGGACRVYSHTTNPGESAGDGVAMAARAGATLADMEFVQFHPTALDTGLDPMPLLTEALRGEGATLVNESGERFLTAVHPDAELAPRDVVARAIWEQLQSGRRVFLDVRRVLSSGDREGFALCRMAANRAGFDPEIDLLPVAPAAHYHIGGVAVDLEGRSSLPGLWAAGEAASTGVHGANRLASNSLLEGVVFGRAAGRSAEGDEFELSEMSRVELPSDLAKIGANADEGLVQIVRKAMWERVGLVRSAGGLNEALNDFEALRTESAKSTPSRNVRLVAELITQAALTRTESRGVHYRMDHPQPSSEFARRLKAQCPSQERVEVPFQEVATKP